jgi:4-amino-4-deoxy-L-arabinose transferase-like glycosyltransferase
VRALALPLGAGADGRQRMTMTLFPSASATPEGAASTSSRVSRVRVQAAAALLGLAAFLLLLLIIPGTLDGTDARSMYEVARSIIEHGDVTTLSKSTGVPGLYGHFYSKYGPAQSLAALPLYLVGRALTGLVPAHFAPELPIMAASLLPAIVTALTVELFFLTAIELGATAFGALALSVVYMLATPAVVYAAQWFSEPMTGCALMAAVYALLRERRSPSPWWPFLAGVALAVAVCTRLDALLFLPPLLAYLLLPSEERWGRASSFLLPLGLALVGLASYNADRFGSPFESGYGIANRTDWFADRDAHPPHTPASLAQGLYGLLLSPGKGLLEYAPPLLLAPLGAALLWARRRAEAALLLSLFSIYLVAHANVLIRWLGGWSWGPRFLIPVVPLALLLLAPLLGPREQGEGARPSRRAPIALAALAALAALGLAVQAPALAVHEPHVYLAAIETPYLRTYCRPYNPASPTRVCAHPITAWTHIEDDYSFKPGDSLILGSWRVLGRADTWTRPGELAAVAPRHMAKVSPRGARAQPPDVSPATVAAKNITTAPHAWWWLLYLQGVPAAPLWGACMVFFAGALACAGAAARLLRVRPVPLFEKAHLD